MIFIPDTSTTPETVTVSVPTTRKSARQSATLSIVHESTKAAYEYAISSLVNAPTSINISFTISESIPSGQYKYTLSDQDGVLSIGILQAGKNTPTITPYQTQKTIKVYEG